MVLVLCIGDLHLPHRAADLPTKFKSLLVPGKISHILCPGNLCTEVCQLRLCRACQEMCARVSWRAAAVQSLLLCCWFLPVLPPIKRASCMLWLQTAYDYLRSVCSDVTVTQGDFDESTKWPDTQVGWLGWCCGPAV